MKTGKKPVATGISGFGLIIIGYISPIYLEFIKPYANYILWLGICLIVSPWLLSLFGSIRNKIRNSHTTTDLSDTIQINNPDDFPSLNMSALKRHISLIIKNPNHSFNRLVRSVVLYHGLGDPDDPKYILVVEIPDTISIEPSNDHKALTRHWDNPEGCIPLDTLDPGQ